MSLPAADPIYPTTAAFVASLARVGLTARFRRLDRLEQYYRGLQHSYKVYSWDGIRSTVQATHLSEHVEAMPGFHVPMRERRPANPSHLARVIVDRFTALLFSEDRWPAIEVPGDPVAEDFAAGIVVAANLAVAMVQARRLGGSMGAVGISYKWLNGKPRVEVHNVKHLVVPIWEDREELVPAHVVKTYRVPREEVGRDGKAVRVEYQFRRDWTATQEIRYQPVRVLPDTDPEWVPEEGGVVTHNLGFCPFVWVQNQPSEDPDGEPDYEGLTDENCGRGQGALDTYDVVCSATVGGTVANVDPTLILSFDPTLVAPNEIQKGSDNAINVGIQGKAAYLEISGQSVQAGQETARGIRQSALDVAQCVVVDPEKISGAAQSAKAIEYIYLPMIAKAGVFRSQWGRGLLRVVDGLRAAARAIGSGFRLPPRKIEERKGGEMSVRYEQRSQPGGDGESCLRWGPFFSPTPADEQAKVQAASLAAGGKAVVSQKTAVRYVAATFGVEDVDEELDRIEEDEAAASKRREDQFAGPIGGGLFGRPKPTMPPEDPEDPEAE